MMPSHRRLKAGFLIVLLVVVLTLYITASERQTRSSNFYTRTQTALAEARSKKEAKLHSSDNAAGDRDSTSDRLKAAEADAKQKANEKGANFHSEETKQKAIEVKDMLNKAKDKEADKDSSKSSSGGRKELEEDEKSVAGRKIMKVAGLASYDKLDEKVLKKDEVDLKEKEKRPHEESADEKRAHAELNDILKKSPVIIFSKTYCPYSRRAKHILLEKYRIFPTPYVVELDIHPLGKQLQAYLGDITGRKTVPNVLINAKSIGGGDDVQKLDDDDELIATVQSMGGKRMQVTKTAPEGLERHKRKEQRRLRF